MAWGPTSSCPGCGKHLDEHCRSAKCPWGRCPPCGLVWNRRGRAIEDAPARNPRL